MDFKLTREQEEFMLKARKFAQEEIRPIAQQLWEEGKYSIELVQKAAKLGFLGVDISPEYGGAGKGSVSYALMIAELAKECAGTTVGIAVTNLAGEAINQWGNEAQKKKYLPMLTSAEAIAGAFCLSEASSASDAAKMNSYAAKDGDSYIINGQKMWITNGLHSKVFVVMAATERGVGARGISAFIVEKDMEGVSIGKTEEKMGLLSSNTVSVNLDDVRVPAENRLGKEGDGFKVAMTALDVGRIGVAAQAIGIGLSAVELARDYSKKRTQFGKTLADFQAIQWMLADATTELEAARLLDLRAAWIKDNKKPFTQEASMAKLYASEAANRAVRNMLQIFGGGGYLNTNPVAKKFRDAKVTTIYEGSSEIQRLVIARNLLKQ